jgi:hypothetical protein
MSMPCDSTGICCPDSCSDHQCADGSLFTELSIKPAVLSSHQIGLPQFFICLESECKEWDWIEKRATCRHEKCIKY